MEITGIGDTYNNVYGNTYTSQKNENAKKAEKKAVPPTQTKFPQTTTANDVSNYYSYLAKKYDCVRNGNIGISGAYLKECANNPDKAKELEENFAFYKESYQNGYESAKANARAIGARLTNYSENWSIDNTGNIIMQVSTTVVSNTKGWKELKEEQEEHLKEKREQEEKEEKLKEKMQKQKLEDVYYPEFNQIF